MWAFFQPFTTKYHNLSVSPNNNDVSPGQGPQRICGVIYMTVSDQWYSKNGQPARQPGRQAARLAGSQAARQPGSQAGVEQPRRGAAEAPCGGLCTNRFFFFTIRAVGCFILM